ncbi:MAG: S41 family peptidase [bacterium]|nr:S41 family peptidase [bacterium]
MYRQKKPIKLISWLSSVLVVAVLFFGLGYSVRIVQEAISTPTDVKEQIVESDTALEIENNNTDIDFQLFWDVWNLVQEEYIDQPIDDSTLFYGAITGIAAAVGDPHTVYFNPELSEKFVADINGEFEGIGAEVGIKDAQLVVIAPLANSPAEIAGLKSNDAIIKIDEVDTIGITIDKAVDLIRGEKGTDVVLTVYRSGAEDFQDISITRDVIDVPSMEYEIIEQDEKKIAFVKLTHFIEGTSVEFAEIANEIILDSPDGLILDLRNNPGGILQESIEVASQFVPDGVIVYEKNSDGTEDGFDSTGSGLLAGISPVVILINGGSASASEIVAGALHDHEKALLVGTKSFGKGSVQDYKVFEDKSSIKITIAHWLTPNKVDINKEGIAPDVEIDISIEDYKNDQDPQLDKAIEEILK